MAFKNDFRPDIIAGNPPYNRGIDIEFAFDAFNIIKIAMAFIVPAKWQTGSDNHTISSKYSYGKFREDIVKHIDKVVFYPESAELFEIRNVEGISIYVADKQKTFNEALIINHCRHQKYFESEDKRSINNRETLHNIGISIINKLEKFEKFKFSTGDKYRFAVSSGNKINSGNGWGYSNRQNPSALLNTDGKFKCTSFSVILDREKSEVDARGASSITFTSDSKEECKNFITWLDSKLVRFLIAMNISKFSSIFEDDYFRFVPKPFKLFREPYTDNEIYKYYGLDNNEIDIIESIIMNR